jgi:hypothetical protein
MENSLSSPLSDEMFRTAIDDLGYFSRGVGSALVDSIYPQISQSANIADVLSLHSKLADSLADRLGIASSDRNSFTDSYMRDVSSMSFEQLKDVEEIRRHVDASIDSQVQRIASTSDQIVERIRSVSDASYERMDKQRAFVAAEISAIADEMGLRSSISEIRFELSRGSFSFGGGTVGAEAQVNRGVIAISDTMLSLLESGTMSPEEFRRNLREEIRHTIDLRNGLTDEPRWQDFAERVYADRDMHEAWRAFAAEKGKSPPAYYKEYGGLTTELMVDLLDMQQGGH